MANKRMMSVTTNVTQFIKGVKSDLDYFTGEAVEALDETLDKMVIYMRRDVHKRTWALHNSIRKTTWDTLFGKTFWRKRVTAGGYTVNIDTGRLVDYAEVEEYGNGRNRAPHPYFWHNVHKQVVKLDVRMKKVLNNTSRRVGMRQD